MAANRYPIGVSSYEDGTPSSPHGVMQTVTSEYLALQLRSAAVEFDRDVLKNNGERLTPNEGVREIDRQRDLYNLYLAGKGALAAYPGTSTHGPQIGTAVDFGITRADGSNRALSESEWPKLYAILESRGVKHTGATFRVPEAWHCNGIYTAKMPPITNAPLMGTKTKPVEDEDEADETARRLLMAASDTLTVYQRIGTNGKDEDTYCVAGAGLFGDLIVKSVVQPLGKRIGVQFSGKELRNIFLRDGVTFKKYPAAQYDQTRAMYASLSEVAQGKVA